MNYKDYFKDNKCPYCNRPLVFNEDYTDCHCEVEECSFNHQFEGFKVVASIPDDETLYKNI